MTACWVLPAVEAFYKYFVQRDIYVLYLHFGLIAFEKIRISCHHIHGIRATFSASFCCSAFTSPFVASFASSLSASLSSDSLSLLELSEELLSTAFLLACALGAVFSFSSSSSELDSSELLSSEDDDSSWFIGSSKNAKLPHLQPTTVSSHMYSFEQGKIFTQIRLVCKGPCAMYVCFYQKHARHDIEVNQDHHH